MAELNEALLLSAANTLGSIDPSDKSRKLSPDSLLDNVKNFHDSVNAFDTECNARSSFITKLVSEGLHEEQVWQQQKLRLNAAKRFYHEQFTLHKLEQVPLVLKLQKDVPENKRLPPSKLDR